VNAVLCEQLKDVVDTSKMNVRFFTGCVNVVVDAPYVKTQKK